MGNVLFRSLMLLFVFLLPVDGRFIAHTGVIAGSRWEYGDLSLYATDVLLLSALVLYFFSTKKPEKNKLLFITLWSFIAWVVLSSWWASDHVLALFSSFRFIAGGMLVVVISRSAALSRSALIAALAFGAAAEGILTLVQFWSQAVPAVPALGMAYHDAVTAGDAVLQGAFGRVLRPYGTLPHPNILGGFLVAAALLYIAQWLGQYVLRARLAYTVHEKGIQWVHVLVVAPIILGVMLTFSRGAWLGFAVGCIFLLFKVLKRQDVRKKRIIVYSVVTASFMALVALPFAPYVASRFQGERLEVRSITERITGIEDAVPLIVAHPFWGSGIGTYTLNVIRTGQSTDVWASQPVHNVFILALAEVGAVGVFLLLLLIIRVLQTIRTNDAKWFYAPLWALVIIGLFDHWLWSLHFGTLFFFLVIALVVKDHASLRGAEAEHKRLGDIPQQADAMTVDNV